MNLREVLSGRTDKDVIGKVVCYVSASSHRQQMLYSLTDDENDQVSWHAWWACEHLTRQYPDILVDKREDIIGRLLSCQYTGKKRIMLNILQILPLTDSVHVELLNFCLDQMLQFSEPSGTQASAMKLAYKICRAEPELLNEFKEYLNNVEEDFYSPALLSTRKNIIREMNKKGKLK